MIREETSDSINYMFIKSKITKAKHESSVPKSNMNK